MPLPRPPRLPSLTNLLPGAPPPQRGSKLTQAEQRPFPDPPYWWGNHPLTEFIVYDDLTRRRGWKIFSTHLNDPNGAPSPYGADAWYQVPIPVPGLYDVGVFKGDFLILPSGKGGSPGPPYSRGIVLDPITLFTHSQSGQDRMRRALLAQAGYLLIWIDGAALMSRPHAVITQALAGQDVSSIGLGER